MKLERGGHYTFMSTEDYTTLSKAGAIIGGSAYSAKYGLWAVEIDGIDMMNEIWEEPESDSIELQNGYYYWSGNKGIVPG